MSKEKDLQFIKNFSKIKIGLICDDLKIDRSAFWKGEIREEKITAVKNEIIKRVKALFN